MKIMTEHIPEQVIPAHDCVTELYTFDELPSCTQDRLVRNYADAHADNWNDEYRDTLKELEKLFGVKCVDWGVDGWSHDYTLYAYYSTYTHIRLEDAAKYNYEDDDDSDYYYLALRGNRAMGKCWTLWKRKVVKGRYYSGPFHGTPGKDFHYARRQSKVLFDDLHDGTCPLTGFCADNNALDPLWDMMEGKHIKDGMTIAEMIDACFESFFAAWQEDIRYNTSEEAFRENEMAEWYDEDGNAVDIPDGAVLTDPPTEAVA